MCKIKWCKKVLYAKLYCRFHYDQKRFTGRAGKRKKVIYGSGTILTNGYRMVMHKGKQVREHRLIMEKFLRRKLHKYEVVHHINHIRTDNRISNLEVKSSCDHMRDHMVEYWKCKKISGHVV